MNRSYSSRMPLAANLSSEDREMLEHLLKTKNVMEKRIEGFELKKGIKVLMGLAKEANRYFDKTKPWENIKKNKEKCSRTINTCLQVVDGLATLMEPYLPFTSKKILKMLDIEENEWDSAGRPRIPESKEMGKIEILFKKVENETIRIEKEKLGIEEVKMADIISIEDFSKVEMKVATIESAEKVENAQKLLKMIADIGGEKRQLVAGIAEFYKLKNLLAKALL